MRDYSPDHELNAVREKGGIYESWILKKKKAKKYKQFKILSTSFNFPWRLYV